MQLLKIGVVVKNQIYAYMDIDSFSLVQTISGQINVEKGESLVAR